MTKFKISKQDYENQIFDDVFNQLEEGKEVYLTKEQAEILGYFEEDAISARDIEEDEILVAHHKKTGEYEPHFDEYENDK